MIYPEIFYTPPLRKLTPSRNTGVSTLFMIIWKLQICYILCYRWKHSEVTPPTPVSPQFGKNYKIGPIERWRVRTPDSVTYTNNILFDVTVKNKLINLLFVSNRIFPILFSQRISNVFSPPSLYGCVTGKSKYSKSAARPNLDDAIEPSVEQN